MSFVDLESFTQNLASETSLLNKIMNIYKCNLQIINLFLTYHFLDLIMYAKI